MTLGSDAVTPLVKVANRTAKDFSNTALSWEYAMFDTHGMWDPADPKKVFIPIDGIYELIFSLTQNGTVVSFDPFISRNFIGAPPNGHAEHPDRILSYLWVPRIGSAAYSNFFGCTVHPLKAGDYVACSSQRGSMGVNSSGTTTENAMAFFIVRWLDRLA